MQPQDVTVFGAGYVGLVTGACLSASGHSVTVLDVDERKLESLRQGRTPFHEPGLDEIITDGIAVRPPDLQNACRASSRTATSSSWRSARRRPRRAADLRFVRAVIERSSRQCRAGTVVIMKSTVPPGTGALLAKRLAARRPLRLQPRVPARGQRRRGLVPHRPHRAGRRARGRRRGHRALRGHRRARRGLRHRERRAHQVRVATRSSPRRSASPTRSRACATRAAPTSTTSPQGVGLDSRIGPAFLNAGIGYGGSCFPKDTRALDFLSSINGYDFHLLKAVIDVNARQRLPAGHRAARAAGRPARACASPCSA